MSNFVNDGEEKKSEKYIKILKQESIKHYEKKKKLGIQNFEIFSKHLPSILENNKISNQEYENKNEYLSKNNREQNFNSDSTKHIVWNSDEFDKLKIYKVYFTHNNIDGVIFKLPNINLGGKGKGRRRLGLFSKTNLNISKIKKNNAKKIEFKRD